MKAGDHLRVLKDGVWDHAIDVGDRTVIRWVPRLGVLRSGQGEFVSGAERGEVVVHRERTFKPRDVVARAFSRFAESAYAAMFASPEQFAIWCKNGQLPAVVAAPATPKKAGARKAGPARAPAKAAAPAPKKVAPKPAPKAKAPARKATAKAAPKKVAAKRVAARKAAPRKPAKPVRKPAPKRAAKKVARRPAKKATRRR